MARFKAEPPEPAPERLTRFCWAQWPDVPPEEAIKRWHLARMAWHDDHKVREADGSDMSVLGSYVDLHRAKRVAHLTWGNAVGSGPGCCEAGCDGDTRCVLGR